MIKREFARGRDSWSLKRLHHYGPGNYNYVNTFGGEDVDRDGVNRQLLMLLSAFHVSTPTPAYKHWLNVPCITCTSAGKSRRVRTFPGWSRSGERWYSTAS